MAKVSKRKQTIVARAVIIERGKILLCQAKGKSWWYLPGGHVEAGEFVLEALDRELREELGSGIGKAEFMGAHDNRYIDSYIGPNQELGLIFLVRLKKRPVDQEDHIRTSWMPVSRLGRAKIMPNGISANIRRWLLKQHPFWQVNR